MKTGKILGTRGDPHMQVEFFGGPWDGTQHVFPICRRDKLPIPAMQLTYPETGEVYCYVYRGNGRYELDPNERI